MGKGNPYLPGLQLTQRSSSSAEQPDMRPAGYIIVYFDLVEGSAVFPARAYGFEERFFGGKPGGLMLIFMRLCFAVGYFEGRFS